MIIRGISPEPYPTECPFFYFPTICDRIQRHEVVRSPAIPGWTFEGIGSNSQQADRRELSVHRHCLPICEKLSIVDFIHKLLQCIIVIVYMCKITRPMDKTKAAKLHVDKDARI